MPGQWIEESHGIGKELAEIECKLAYWRKQRETSERVIEMLTTRMGILATRQRELINANAATGS